MEQQSRKTHITAATIRSLRPSEGVQVIRDTSLKGFQIRVLPSGNAVFWAEARFGGGKGRNMKFKIGGVDMPLPDARERARVALDKIRSGIDPLQEKQMQAHEGKTLRQLIKDFYEVRVLKPSTKAIYGYHEKEFKGWINKRVADITDYEIGDWYARGKHKQYMTDGAFRFLHTLMKFAIARRIIQDNPCLMVTHTGQRFKRKRRTGHIESHNLGKFFKALIEYKYVKDSEMVARDVILLIITTGLRSEEARALIWKNVDLKKEKRAFIIPDTKNGLDHTVSLTPLSYSMFLYRKEHGEGSEYVFRIKESSKAKSGYVTNIKKTLGNICKLAEIPVVTVHDLRRTFATALNLIGVGLIDGHKLMNHKSKDMTVQYTQAEVEHLRDIYMRVVDFYDLKIEYHEKFKVTGDDPDVAPLWTSGYAIGTLNHVLYDRGSIAHQFTDDPTGEWKKATEETRWG